MQVPNIQKKIFEERPMFRLFQKLAGRISFTFALVFTSSWYIWVAACYAIYFVYATVDFSAADIFAGIKYVIFAGIAILLIHYTHYGVFHKFGLSGFGKSIKTINRYFDSDYIFKNYKEIDDKKVEEIYNLILYMARRNLIVCAVYTFVHILSVVLFYYFYLDPSAHPDKTSDLVLVFTGGIFATIIYGYFVFNITEYLLGPYKEKLEKIMFEKGRIYQGGYILSFRYKAIFAILLILFSMIVLTIFVRNSVKPLEYVYFFIFLSVVAIGFLLFIVVNNFSIELSRVNIAAKDLASGGDGLYFPYFLNKEIMLFSHHYNTAAEEIKEIRSDLDRKVQDGTRELQAAYEKLNTLYKQSQADIHLGKRIQEGILSRDYEAIAGIKVFLRYYPMRTVGGDIYDIKEISPGYIRVFLADTEGHGVRAALVTMIIKGEYEKVRYSYNTSVLLEQLNRSYVDLYSNLDVFFSCVVLDLDLNRGILSYSSAGHPGQILIHDGLIKELTHTGKLVGIVRDASYRLEEKEISIHDKLILFTDGLYEQFNDEDEEFGEKRLYEFIEINIPISIRKMLKSLIATVSSFLGGTEKLSLHDDITLIGIEIERKTGRNRIN